MDNPPSKASWKYVFKKYRCLWTDFSFSFPKKPNLQLDVGDEPVYAVHLFGNGKYLASGGLGGILRVFDLETGTLVRELIGHTSSINFIATCRNVFGDGTYKDDVLVTAGDDSTIKVWNPMTGELVRDLADIHQDMEINTLNVIPTQWCGDITPNRAPIIASAGDEKIVFLTYLDEKNHHSLPNLEGHDGLIWTLTCAYCTGRNSVLMASGAFDGCVKVWDVKTAECLFSLEGDNSNTLHVWDLITQEKVVERPPPQADGGIVDGQMVVPSRYLVYGGSQQGNLHAWYKPPLGEVVVRRLTEDGVWRETAFRDILVTADQRVLVWRARGKPTSTRYQIPRSIEEDATTTRVIGEVNGEEESTDSDVDIPEVPGNEAETTND